MTISHTNDDEEDGYNAQPFGGANTSLDSASTLPPSNVTNAKHRVRKHKLSPFLLHDLRTPINHLVGYSEMLLEQASDTPSAELMTDIAKIRIAAVELLHLIELNFQSNTAKPFDLPVVTTDTNSKLSVVKSIETSVLPSAETSLENPPLVLVVDDNELNRDILSQRLEKQGHSVVCAADGFEALECVRNHAFDLVLLDIMMPGMDGYEVLRQLKALEATRNIPVIVISALNELGGVVRCIELGADDYLSKPFEPLLLKARVASCLEKKRAYDREQQLHRSLQESYHRLEELEKARNGLMQMIVHDLRTPLTSVMSGMQSVEMLGELNVDQQELLAIALSGAATLLRMVNDLLDVDKLESGLMELDYAPINIESLVAGAVAQVATLLIAKRLILVTSITPDIPMFEGDEDKLTRVLINLIGNAIKFTASGGQVEIAVIQNDKHDRLTFSVTDTGEGIPASEFQHVFEKFGQVSTRQTGRTMGTGLGLAFCKLAVEAHGGEIGVTSTVSQGSIFYFTIPTKRASDSTGSTR